MIKIANGLLVVLVLVSGALLYGLEYRTRALERGIAVAKREISDADEDIKLLGAEWSNLTRPERIQMLAAQNLGLAPLTADQYVTVQELPGRMQEMRARAKPVPRVDAIGDLLEDMPQ